MLARKNRFHGHNSVRMVYRQGMAVRSGFGSVHTRVNEKRREYRAAVVVSKKVSKSAVTRNRIRRRIYEILRSQAPLLAKPYDLVFTVYAEQAVDMPAEELQEQVVGLLRSARVIPKA